MQNITKNRFNKQLYYKAILSNLEFGILLLEPIFNNKIITTINTIYANNEALDMLKTVHSDTIEQIVKKFISSPNKQEYEIKLNTTQSIQINTKQLEKNILLSCKRIIKKKNAGNNKKFNFIINKQGYITYTDSDFANNILYSKNDILNKNFQNLLYKKKPWNDVMLQLEQKGHIKDTELILKNKNGEFIPITLDLETIYNSFGRSIAYKGTLHKNSLNKEHNNQYLQNIKQKLNTTEKIAKLVAHEVRNPITNINLALAQLEQELPNNDNKHNFCVDVIRRNSNRINMLVNQLLNTSITEYLTRKKYSINDIVNDTLELASDRIRLNEIAIIKILTKQIDIDLDVDVDKIVIAFLNIIINAIEAMEPQKGILTIQTDIISNSIITTIEDNGIGIEQKKIKQIFNPFYTNKATGMGLGLTSAYNIIHSHNGEIKISSREKKGSTFSIYFYK